ncbi:MAG: hypothetical protein RL375_4019 [Pseudomonadota bacterium]|jgi:phage baseplate assembly protein V
MMGWMSNLLRRARLRGLKDGAVQVARTEALEGDAKDEAERWQDYGFAANPVDGQGLVINWAGHTVVLRMDRITERPAMAPYDVAIWHKEGHQVRLKAGKVVEVTCDHLVVNAAQDVTITSPVVTITASTSTTVTSPTVAVAASTSVTLTTPATHATGAATIDGNLVVGGSAAVAGGVGAGGSAPVAGKSVAPTMEASTSLKVAGKEMSGHTHTNVQPGAGTSGPPT